MWRLSSGEFRKTRKELKEMAIEIKEQERNKKNITRGNKIMEANFGKNLKANRTERKLSQCQVAHQIGCTQQCVSGWENGKIEPTMSYLWKLADVFDISIDILIGRRDY